MSLRIKSEVEMFPRETNWILEFGWEDELYKLTPEELYKTPYWEIRDEDFYYVECQYYARPNEDNLLNTLTEALEGAPDEIN